MRDLSTFDIDRVQRATEKLLEKVGVRVEHDVVLKKARAAGARVDEAGGTVRLPAGLVRELLGLVPRQYSVCGIGGRDFVVGGAEQRCLAIVIDPWIIDSKSQLPRRPVLEDIRRHTIVAERLEAVAMMSRMDYPVADVEGPGSSLRALETHLVHHSKHNYVLPATLESFRQWLEIIELFARHTGLPPARLMTVGVPILSPLRLTAMNAEILLEACGRGHPIVSTICPMAGTSSPYSLAGTLLVGNIENVFLAVLTQILRPGNPYLYAMGPSRTNMRTGEDMYYTLDKVLWKAAAVKLALAYGIPVAAECGGTMTYRYDQQSGAEGVLFMLTAQRSGAHILAGLGSCFNAVGMSVEMMLIQTAWLEAAKFLQRGLDMETLERAVESIRRAGPGAYFLTDDFTLDRLHAGEFFENELFDHTGAHGPHPSLLERAHAKAEALIGGFKSPVPEPIREDLRRYLSSQLQDS